MLNLISDVTIPDGWLYAVMIFLLLGNIAFIILFVFSVARNNKLEEQMQNNLKEIIGKTEHDKNCSQPLGSYPDANNKYRIVESSKKDGFYVTNKKTREQVAFASTKEEALEIIKELARNN